MHQNFVCYPLDTETFQYTQNMDLLQRLSDRTTVGGRIRYYRLKQGLLQEDVAIHSGIDICTLKRYENNQQEYSLEICNKIARAIGIEPSLIYDDYLSFLSNNYGVKIMEFRKTKKLTQKILASITGVHRKTVIRWEKEIGHPSRRHFEKLLQFKG